MQANEKGINKVYWQLYRKPPRVPSSAVLLGQAMIGPPVQPGMYTLKITKDKEVYEAPVEISFDQNSRHSVSDRQTRLDALYKAYDMLEELAYIDANDH